MARDQGTIESFLARRKVCATGPLANMTHAELAALVESSGGTFIPGPRRTGFLMVIGSGGTAAARECPTRSFRRARRLRTCGYPVEMLSEDEFLELTGIRLPDAQRGNFTIGDVAEFLGISPARLRRWLRMGLVSPVKSVHRLAFFDFHEVGLIKRLCELQVQGASLAAIQDSLARIRGLLRNEDLSLAQLAGLEHGGRLVFRHGEQLLDGSGQRYFDFSGEEAEFVSGAAKRAECDADALFDAALALEDAGRLKEAAEAYRRALVAAPEDAALHFNLGNVLFSLGDYAASRASLEAALRRDGKYAEAWNNLGIVQDALGECYAAIGSFRRAIELVPGYSLARENLLRVLQSRTAGRLSIVRGE